jgi:hypothetical protein
MPNKPPKRAAGLVFPATKVDLVIDPTEKELVAHRLPSQAFNLAIRTRKEAKAVAKTKLKLILAQKVSGKTVLPLL